MRLNTYIDKRYSTLFSETGNAVFLVLIGIVLFAALSYAVASFNKGDIHYERETVTSAELLQYAGSISQAVQKIRMDGCQDSQISFERWPFDGTDTAYVNPNSPADFSCFVFHPAGGGVAYRKFPDINDGTDYFFHHKTCIPGIGSGYQTDNIGTDCATVNGSEILMIVPNMDIGLCLVINEKAGIEEVSAEPPQDHDKSWDSADLAFKGTFGTGYQITDASTLNKNFDYMNYGCFEGNLDPLAGTYHFYYVIMAR